MHSEEYQNDTLLYNKKNNAFVILMDITPQYFLVKMGRYLNDAYTSKTYYKVSHELVHQSIVIINIDQAGHGIHFDGTDWRVPDIIYYPDDIRKVSCDQAIFNRDKGPEQDTQAI